ncbi:hypothetical protein BV22DRAFT_749531 [Leucogyrophana mollusca]|uniref:Uncharacterized protein n=1 Tax=Leucogyrophana mollusca TaxID=85980 RepID=A0ACB8B6V1_9AGAM|nr:hypothetical protein BV22DRAFT_749531 [Leucogyrophana mollusca]
MKASVRSGNQIDFYACSSSGSTCRHQRRSPAMYRELATSRSIAPPHSRTLISGRKACRITAQWSGLGNSLGQSYLLGERSRANGPFIIAFNWTLRHRRASALGPALGEIPLRHHASRVMDGSNDIFSVCSVLPLRLACFRK